MDKGTIARTAVLLFALINQVLTMAGWNPLPFSEDDIYAFITGAFTVVSAIVAWWKNNFITKRGLAQKEQLKKAGLD